VGVNEPYNGDVVKGTQSMKQPIFRKEGKVQQIRISRAGFDGFALFRVVFDPERGESTSNELRCPRNPSLKFPKFHR